MTEAGESQLDAVGRILAAAVTDGVPGVAGVPGVPGLTAAVGRGPRTLGSWALGQADTATPRPVQPDTVFDLASLTKVVATTTVTLALAGQGLIGLDDQVVKHLPAATQLATPEVTVRQLLTHTTGLPSSVKFYEWCADRDQLLRELYATPLEVPSGTRVAYSDLGFMMLGEIGGGRHGRAARRTFPTLGVRAARHGRHRLPIRFACGRTSGKRTLGRRVRGDGTARGRDAVDWRRARRECTGHGRGRRARGIVLDRGGPGYIRRVVGGARRRRRARARRAAPGIGKVSDSRPWGATAVWAGSGSGTATTSSARRGPIRRCRTPASPGRASPSMPRAASGWCC